jgi:CO dehydrogenase/acetyl-CoA synthase gamma subunit (corrinoid Fe-S protein)
MTELSGLQIFKYLPGAQKAEHANCKECGFPTCMAFALKLAKSQADIEACSYAMPELKQILEQSRKQPQKTVEINGVKIGGENVLYRHEKTFINQTAIAVIADTEAKRKRVEAFEITRVNEKLKVDLIFNSKDELKNFPLREAHEAQELIDIRRKAILEKDEAYADPVYVYFPHGSLNETCARAAYYICKYANMLVFEDFDEDMIASLLTLRQNIFTDPQKPLQVEPNIYEFNNPDENPLIFLTTNFALTYFAVANELESLSVPSYLIVVPAEGMSVLTAWSAEKFTAKIVANTLKKFGLAEKVKTRKIIIPGLLAHMKEELEEAIPEFEMVVGSNEAYKISELIIGIDII